MGKEESKKTYTAAGKRKFKATVLSFHEKTQSIFSAKPIAPTIGEPPATSSYPFLRFKQTSENYQMEASPAEIPFPIVTSEQKEFPMPELQTQGEVILPDTYELTTIDYRLLS